MSKVAGFMHAYPYQILFPKNIEWCVYVDSDTLMTTNPFELELFFNNEIALLVHLERSKNLK